MSERAVVMVLCCAVCGVEVADGRWRTDAGGNALCGTCWLMENAGGCPND
jgi:hypothetical protein